MLMAIRYAFKKLTRWADVRAKPHFSLEARPRTFEISIRVDAQGNAHHILFNLVPKFRFSDFGILLRLSGREPSGIVRRNRRICGGLARRRSSNGDWPRPAGLCLAGLHLEGLAGGETGGDDNVHHWPPGISTAIVSPPFAVGGTVTVSGPLGTAATGATGSPATTTTSSVLVIEGIEGS